MQSKKKMIITFIIASVLAMLFVFTAAASEIGDVDGDGVVAAADARLALRASVGLENYAPGSGEFLACDVDFDGFITASDARLILRASVGLETLTPATHTHVWGDKIYTTANKGPTCTKSATFYRECSVCGERKIETEPAINHKNKKLVSDANLAPTCTKSGYYEYYCPDCGETFHEEFDALGHTVKPGAITLNNDIICSRCEKTLTPSFNGLVNGLKTSDLLFSSLTRNESFGTLKKDPDIRASVSFQTLIDILESLGREIFSVDDIKASLIQNITQNRLSFSNHEFSPQMIAGSSSFPIAGKDYVSALKEADITGINVVEELTEVDFISEIPDNADIDKGDDRTDNMDLTKMKELVTADKDITKITVTTKTEKYSSVKNSSETALMRITGFDIKTLYDVFNTKQEQNDDSLSSTFEMTSKDFSSDCTVSYYFAVSEEDGVKVYTPIAAKYLTHLVADEHLSLKVSMGIFTLLTGEVDFEMTDLITNYYIFTPNK